MQKPEQVMQDFAALLDKYRNDPEAWSQIYKVINYKPTQNIPKGQTLEPEKIREFLRLSKPGNSNEFDPYDDMIYFDDNKVKEIVLRQNFLIAKGYFDPKAYFPSINLSSLDDTTFDDKIKGIKLYHKTCQKFQMINKEEEKYDFSKFIFLIHIDSIIIMILLMRRRKNNKKNNEYLYNH